MGDQGKLYVADEIVPAYKDLLKDADLVLPNGFEAELLSDTKITDVESLTQAITIIHRKYQIPHIVVTSLRLNLKKSQANSRAPILSVVGSSCREGKISATQGILSLLI